MVWVNIILFIVVFALSYLLRPKPEFEDQKPASLGDFNFPTATEDRVLPILWGRVKMKGPNVVWYGDLSQDAITEDVKTGLFSSKTITKGFKYNLGIQFGLCRGENTTLKKVFIGEEEVFAGTISSETSFDIDEADLFGGNDEGQGGVQAECNFYPGTTTQGVSPYLARFQDAGAGSNRTPRYTGATHLVIHELNVAGATAKGAYLGNTTSIKRWAFELERYPPIFSGQAAGENRIGGVPEGDANPVNIIYEMMTNREWGLGHDATELDVGAGSSFLSAADTCITEANGFSLIVDSEREIAKVITEILRQINGVLFMNQVTGKWTMKLARDDYNIDTVPQISDSNCEVQEFARSSWSDTTNWVWIKYAKRDDEYKESFAMAQDVANALIQGGGTIGTAKHVKTTINYPGCKTSALASNLASRDLRELSYPLAKAKLILTREFWDINIGDVLAWTNTKLNFTKLPMRVASIDFGRLQENKIVVNVVQDVFQFAAASFGTPDSSGWSAPSNTPVAYPSDEQFGLEAPRALIVRDPKYASNQNISKVFCGARRQNNEVAIQVKQRNASGATSGDYFEAGSIIQFVRIGKLNAALNTGTAIPTAAITIKSDPDSQTNLETVFDDEATLIDLGVDLVQLVMVNNEFMLVSSASTNGANVDLENVYRGVLDTVQGEHAADDDVFLVFVGAGLTDTTFPTTNNVDIELRAQSAKATYSGAVTTLNLTMAKRAIRPYPPATVRYNGTATDYGTPDLEGDGSGLNGFGFDVDWFRRAFDTTDEVSAMLSDGTVDATTEYRTRIFVDPDGSNDEVHTGSWATGTSGGQIDRLDIINSAAAGTEIRVQIEARHDILTETNLTSRYNLFHDVTPTTTLSGQFHMGSAVAVNTATAAYTAVDNGTFTVNIGAAYSTAAVEYRINGGGWASVIAATNTTGTIAGVVATDTIELRFTVDEAPDPNFVELKNPSATAVAYGTFS